jgi:hypothetical protein
MVILPWPCPQSLVWKNQFALYEGEVWNLVELLLNSYHKPLQFFAFTTVRIVCVDM